MITNKDIHKAEASLEKLGIGTLLGKGVGLAAMGVGGIPTLAGKALWAGGKGVGKGYLSALRSAATGFGRKGVKMDTGLAVAGLGALPLGLGMIAAGKKPSDYGLGAIPLYLTDLGPLGAYERMNTSRYSAKDIIGR